MLLIIERSCQNKVTGKKKNDKNYARTNDQKAKPRNLLDIWPGKIFFGWRVNLFENYMPYLATSCLLKHFPNHLLHHLSCTEKSRIALGFRIFGCDEIINKIKDSNPTNNSFLNTDKLVLNSIQGLTTIIYKFKVLFSCNIFTKFILCKTEY